MILVLRVDTSQVGALTSSLLTRIWEKKPPLLYQIKMKIFSVSPWNDVWETSVEIFYGVSLPLNLNIACSWSKVCFSQSEALPDLPWHVISVEFLNSFLRQSSHVFSLPRSQASIFFLGARLVFSGKLLVASGNVDCFLKLSIFLHVLQASGYTS